MQPIDNEVKHLGALTPAFGIDYYKGDFAGWQAEGRRKLAELLGIDNFDSCEPGFTLEYTKRQPGFTEYRFKFFSEPDYDVPCVLAVPDGIEKPPVMICLQGHGTGMHITFGRPKYDIDEKKIDEGDRDFARQCIKNGIAALAIEQRCFGEKGGNPRPVCHGPSMVSLLTGRTTIGGRVHDIMRSIDILESSFGDTVDTHRIFCMGNSGGGTATIYACALEERIGLAVPSCAFCTFIDSIGIQNHCECNYIPGIAKYFDMAEITGLIAPRPVIIVNGAQDGIFPAEAAKREFARLRRIYEFAGAPDNCVHIIGSEGHRFYAAQTWPEILKKI